MHSAGPPGHWQQRPGVALLGKRLRLGLRLPAPARLVQKRSKPGHGPLPRAVRVF